MSAEKLEVCDIDPEVKTAAEKFRKRKEKTNGALIFKIDPSKQLVYVDELHDDISVEDLKEELPEHLPVYIMYSYCQKHDDGRISYPLCFIFISPSGCKPELQMMYAGSKLHVVKEVGATKVFELRSYEEFTEEWLLSKLAFFR
ncbi:glia maturation factor gamma [Exaiptasia diaphana]|uniref:ADF-H domain-containing protein n=1 Tax=Exaiptasia diaphana TaxID=2652724 RepID=A0A913X032_EXADI|nr:glia maturation factor gamma [Exaiptasia diaphana]